MASKGRAFMKKLRIAKHFSLPLEAVTETFAFLGKRGSGKTYGAKDMVEELLEAKQQVVIVDPLGVWFGLRSSADGKKPGYPITILGGTHGDIPLEETAGKLVADLIVGEGLSLILDFTNFSGKAAWVRFVTDFAERLYHRNREPIHLVLDEGDMFAPQRPMKGQERMLGAVQDLVRRGRARGIGVTMITQRPAVISKDVLTQAEVLVAFRVTHPRDRSAIYEWVKEKGEEQKGTEVLNSLPGLPIGTAWFWSPGWLEALEKVHFRYARTFDSSRTPKVRGQRIRTPKTVADVNLAAIEKQMKATIERAKAKDPTHLERLLRERDRRIADLEKTTTTGKAIREAHEAACQAERKSHEIVAAVHRENTTLKGWLERYLTLVENVKKLLTKEAPHVEITALQPRKKALPKTTPTLPRPASPVSKPVPPPPRRREPISYPVADSNDHLQPRHLQILRSIARYEALGIHPVSKKQIGADAGHVASGGNFRTLMSQLHTPGYVEYVGQGYVALTDKGREAAGPVEELALPTHQNIMEMWRQRLQPRHLKVLEPIIERYPDPMTKAELGELVELAHESGNFRTLMSQIKTRGLVTYPGPGLVRAADVLFPGGK